MSDCCSSKHSIDKSPKRHHCPVNGEEYQSISATTILHHITKPWQWQALDQSYYYCDDPECKVAYFGEDNSVINTSDLRNSIDIKQKFKNPTICYCFGVTLDTANPEIKEFIIRKTKEKQCACEVRNPSGRCCLKDFP